MRSRAASPLHHNLPRASDYPKIHPALTTTVCHFYCNGLSHIVKYWRAAYFHCQFSLTQGSDSVLREFLRCKIHRASVTEADIEYIGSLAMDEDLMNLAGLEENEVVHIANLTNGERLTTYAIRAPRGSRTICANGAAAHKVRVGDKIIIFGFAMCTEDEIRRLEPRLVFVDESNNPVTGPHKEAYATCA
jgi:aspartate 1-decarboxylase